MVSGKADLGIIPLENVIAGSVHLNYDLWLSISVKLLQSTTVLFLLAVLGLRGTSVNGIKLIASHPKALEQCETFFEKHREIKQLSVDDTAAAALLVANNRIYHLQP